MSASLYQRIGGSAGVTKLVDDIVAAHMVNPAISARFLPMQDDPAKLAEAKQHLRNFLEQGSGGPGQYTGRSMPDAHRGMNINPGEYMAAIDDVMGALKRNNIDEQSQKDVLAILYSLKGEIVNL